MPKPMGWTNEELKRRNRLAKHLISQGYHEAQAYAIATDLVEKARRKHGSHS